MESLLLNGYFAITHDELSCENEREEKRPCCFIQRRIQMHSLSRERLDGGIARVRVPDIDA